MVHGSIGFKHLAFVILLLLGAMRAHAANQPVPPAPKSNVEELQKSIFASELGQAQSAPSQITLPPVVHAQAPAPVIGNEVLRKIPITSDIPVEGPLLDANLESLAPGIRLRADVSLTRKTIDENGLPAMSVSDWVRYESHQVNKTLGVCACDLIAKPTKPLVPLGQTSLRDVNGRKFAVSVVSFEQALSIFQGLEVKIRKSKNSIRDGCHARAYEAAMKLEKRGILVGKAMATGKFQVLSDSLAQGKVNWSFHVAPMLVVQEGLKRSVWVLDPALFSEPVKLETWLSILMQHPRAELKEVFLTNRFVLHPNHRYEKVLHWRSEDIKVASHLLKEERAEKNQEERRPRYAKNQSSAP